jgi:hypothetical protein
MYACMYVRTGEGGEWECEEEEQTMEKYDTRNKRRLGEGGKSAAENVMQQTLKIKYADWKDVTI